jgi:hypothetical protein
MSLVEFFFNGDYREKLWSKGETITKFSFKDELKEGNLLKIGAFKVIVTKVNDKNFVGVIIEQDEKISMFYPKHTNYVNSTHEFKRYDDILE